ncbi:MAG TPA: arginine deiminase [Egibacteraceae bacterium]|nr:arginine deiminase [Actinomycetota bacterium]HWB71679.1 arginine deiminase [Egibacteraceae bacterium]
MSPVTPSVTSEVGRLREVIVHRPDLELRRLTPANRRSLLFDELVWVTKAQAEHDGFVALLRAQGVRVRLLAELLADTLADVAVREDLLARIATVDSCGVELVDRVRGFLDELEPADLVTRLVGGLTVGELPGAGDGFVGGVLGPSGFILPPLPNTVFARDPSAWVADGVVLSPMRMPARQAERRLWQTVYRHHPDFAATFRRVWYGEDDRDYFPATIEGGDVLVLSPACVAIGLSERSHPVAAENLAARLFAAGAAEWVLAVDLPKSRGTMHLDTVMTVVDRAAIVLWPRARELARAYRITPGPHGRCRVREEPDLLRAVAAGLGVDVLRVVSTGEDQVAADREQWDDGNNTLALAPGLVVAYERNVDTNRRLAEAGVTVLEISSYELPRGRGGPRCMACPLVRDPP